MAEQLDVFTTIYRRVWEILKSDDRFNSLVDLRNRIDMTDDEFDSFPPNVPPDALPEMAILQSGFTQNAFAMGQPAVGRTYTLSAIITTEHLNPTQQNAIAEAMLDALINAGQSLGLTTTPNGNKVTGWSVAGESTLQPTETTPGNDRSDLRAQAVGRITVTVLKTIPRKSP